MMTNKTVTQATQPKTTQAANSTCNPHAREVHNANLFITCPEMAIKNHKLANKLSSTTCSMTFRSYSRYTPRYTLPESKCAFFPRAIVAQFSQPPGFAQRSRVHRWLRLVLLRRTSQKIPKFNGWISRNGRGPSRCH